MEALDYAEGLFEKLSSVLSTMGEALPDEYLAILDRMIRSNNESSPFYESYRAWRLFEDEVDKMWEVIEAERSELAQSVLGIARGDIVIAERDGKLVRLQVENASIFTTDERVIFHISGKKFRKDGLPGKRDETIYMQTENDI